jgi:hypothetical protein
MKLRLIVLSAILLSVSLFGYEEVQAQKVFAVGIQGGGGVNFVKFKDNGTNIKDNLKAKISPNIGLFLDINPPFIDNVIIHTALGFRQRAFGDVQPVPNSTLGFDNYKYTVNNSYVHLDGVVRVNLSNKVVKPYIGLGARLDTKVITAVKFNDGFTGSDQVGNTIKDNLDSQTFLVSGVVAAGVKIGPFSAELEWNPDLTQAYKQKSTIPNGGTINGKNSMVSLNVAIRTLGF